MTETRFFYNGFLVSVILIFCAFFLYVGSRIFYYVHTFYGFSFAVLYNVLMLILFILAFRMFLGVILNKPALILNNKIIYIHLFDVIIDWIIIEKVVSHLNNGGYSLSIKLIDNNDFINKVKNPVFRLYFRFKILLSKYIVNINVALLKEKNKVVFNEFNHYLKLSHKSGIENLYSK